MNRPANPILAEIDAFLQRSGMSKTEFGVSSLNDGKLVDNLREGRRLWPETEQKIRDFIKKQSLQQREAVG